MSAVGIVPAAGRGERLGPGEPKALRLLGGVPLLVHAARALAAGRAVELVIVAAPPGEIDSVRALLGEVPGAEVAVVAGGATRQESVRLALAALPADTDVVLVHDAARPLAPVDLVDTVVAAVRGGAGAVVPVLPLADTVKRVDPGNVVLATLDRAGLRAVQTPQGFRREVIERAYAAADDGKPATDDAGLVEDAGEPVLTIAGAEEAFKITRPLDLVLAEAVLARRRADSYAG